MATKKRKTTTYFIKRAEGFRKSYSVHAKNPDGTSPVIKHDIIDSLNTAYRSNQITKESIENQLKDFIANHLKEKKVKKIYCSENAEILDRYWKKVYENKKISDKSSAYNRLRRAVDALGIHSLKSATERELQDAVDMASDQRRVVTALTSLLRFIGRSDVVLQKEKKRRRQVSHLTISQYQQARIFIQDQRIRMLADTCFAVGSREGEAFALNPEVYSPVGRFVLIAEQINRKKRNAQTKTGGIRKAPIISDFLESVEAWINMPVAEKLSIRNERVAEMLQKAVDDAGISKTIVFHDLRHCYAIHLLSKGVNMTGVALALGNSLQVCQEYYGGFDLSDESLMLVVAKI